MRRGAVALLGYLTLQRGIELAIARRNTARLVARGAVEYGAGHYPIMVALHASWLAGLWLLGRDARVRPLPLAAYVVLQGGRFWVLGTLGPRWTTRILVLPGAPPVTSGPFRFVRHPNYAVVAGELAAVPLALGLRTHAVLFTLLNAAMLRHRIRVEEAAWAVTPSPEPGMIGP